MLKGRRGNGQDTTEPTASSFIAKLYRLVIKEDGVDGQASGIQLELILAAQAL